jgi:hypothetical protein
LELGFSQESSSSSVAVFCLREDHAQPFHRPMSAHRDRVTGVVYLAAGHRIQRAGPGRSAGHSRKGRLVQCVNRLPCYWANCSPVESSGSIREKSAVSCYCEEWFASRSTTIFVAGSGQTSLPPLKLDSTLTGGNWRTAGSGARRQHRKIFSHVPTAP